MSLQKFNNVLMYLTSKKKIFVILLFAATLSANAQYGQMPPFTIQVEAITGISIPGLHSFAFAQSGDKWLFIGGRTNGLHGLNSNDGFPSEYKNNAIIVVDTTTWLYYQADLNQLPLKIADPMRSTNMEYLQDGNYLYMLGGFGYDSTLNRYITFPTLTAIHVDNIINAVMNTQPIAPYIRQVIDTNLAICGGDFGKIGSNYYLMFGHNFGGRYADPPVPTFTQVYSNKIKKFSLTDNGTTITLSGYTYQTDTTNFHRRDLNTVPIVKPDGSFAIGAYGGVFQKTSNLPYQEPITIDATGATINTNYQQVMSQYTCAVLPVFDSVTKNMYTTFFGGISLYDYNKTTGLIVYDSLVPFINDITTLTSYANGTIEERVLPPQLAGLLGANSKFILNQNITCYANDVIKLRNLPNAKILIGYLFGGIRAQQGNFGTSAANDTIYRIYLTPNSLTDISEANAAIQNILLFPNPSIENTSLFFNLKKTEKIKIILSDITGKELEIVTDDTFQKGNQSVMINTSGLSSGVYICIMQCKSYKRSLKLIVNN